MATADNLKLIPLPKNTLIAARENGRLYVVDFTEFPHLDDAGAVDWNISVSKLIIGKVQHVRARFLTMEEINIENVVHTNQYPSGSSDDLKVTLFASLDGKNQETAITPTIVDDSTSLLSLACRATAQNFSLQIRGTYNINTVEFTYHLHGKR